VPHELIAADGSALCGHMYGLQQDLGQLYLEESAAAAQLRGGLDCGAYAMAAVIGPLEHWRSTPSQCRQQVGCK
jgi:hypothetical protein